MPAHSYNTRPAELYLGTLNLGRPIRVKGADSPGRSGRNGHALRTAGSAIPHHQATEQIIHVKQLLGAAPTVVSFTAASAHDASDEAKVTLTYGHMPPDVARQEIKGARWRSKGRGLVRGAYRFRLRFIYATVLEGANRGQVDDGPVMTHSAGQSSPELPGDVSRRKRDASATEPVRLLAVFVVDTDETSLTTRSRNQAGPTDHRRPQRPLQHPGLRGSGARTSFVRPSHPALLGEDGGRSWAMMTWPCPWTPA